MMNIEKGKCKRKREEVKKLIINTFHDSVEAISERTPLILENKKIPSHRQDKQKKYI